MEKLKRIYLNFEKVSQDIKLETPFQNDEKYRYITGVASTEDVNSAGFVVENQALLEAWNNVKAEGKNVAVYEKHDMPIGKVISCEENDGKIICTLQIPIEGNERFLSVFDLDVYIGLSIGGWSLDGEWVKNEAGEDVYHVTKFDWIELSVTNCPSNENALLLEAALATKPKEKVEEEDNQDEEDDDNKEQDDDKEKTEEECKKKLEEEKKELIITLEKVKDLIRGIN